MRDASTGEGGSQTLERGLRVLAELARHPAGLTTAEAAVACGLHRSITHRLLVSLHRTGFAARDGANRYSVGPAARALGSGGPPSLRDVAEPVLIWLAAEVDATATLVEVVADAAVTTVVAEPPTDGPRFSYRVGNRDPLDRGSGGLAALASGPPRDGEPERVAAARRDGHVTTHAELNPGLVGLAAPLPGWGVLAAVNVVSSRSDLATTGRSALLTAVEQIQRTLP